MYICKVGENQTQVRDHSLVVLLLDGEEASGGVRRWGGRGGLYNAAGQVCLAG